MGKAVIEVKGVDKLMRHYDKIIAAQGIKRAIVTGTALVEGRAKELCPVETGKLRSSIHSSVSEMTGRVYTNVNYAPFVEFGTGRLGGHPKQAELGLAYREDWPGMIAQPYMYPALESTRKTITNLIGNSIDV